VRESENRDVRDDDLRAVCFLALDALQAQHGDELPYKGALERGFTWRNRRVPFLNRQKGIFRAAAQSGPAALAVMTSFHSPYDDEETEDGFLYAYRKGSVEMADNRALLAAHDIQAPLVYYVGTSSNRFHPIYPTYVTRDLASERRVLLTPGVRTSMGSPRPLADSVERRYAVVERRIRLHQRRFRGIVLPAYRNQCAICTLKEERLLDASHITGDAEGRGEPIISNGLSLCSIHHKAFDNDLVGVSPDYEVHVSRALMDDDDGPMLDLLKGFHQQKIHLPSRRASRPDPERLAVRFDRFSAAT
jgi:putative restriction endonuclease